jgi:tryptophan synthase beta subunit
VSGRGRGRGGEGPDSVLACVGAESSAEGPLYCFVDGFVEDVREEGDDGEAELSSRSH